MIVDDGNVLLPVGEWSPTEVEVTLDSGCTNHVMDAEDAPGYSVQPSVGSRRGQNFIVGNGETIPNEGEVHLNMDAPAGDGSHVPITTNFQVAEINRPLMSVSRICDQGYTCLFTRDGAQVLDQNQQPICRFERSNGLYVASMRLRPPEPFTRPAP